MNAKRFLLAVTILSTLLVGCAKQENHSWGLKVIIHKGTLNTEDIIWSNALVVVQPRVGNGFVSPINEGVARISLNSGQQPYRLSALYNGKLCNGGDYTISTFYYYINLKECG